MPAYDLTTFYPGAVAAGATALRVITPRDVLVVSGTGTALQPPDAPVPVEFEIDGAPADGLDGRPHVSATVETDGSVTVNLPPLGLRLSSGQHLTARTTAPGAGDLSVTLRGSVSGVPAGDLARAPEPYDLSTFARAAPSGLATTYDAARRFSARAARAGVDAPMLVVVRVVRGDGESRQEVTETWTTLSPETPEAALRAAVVAEADDTVEIYLYGEGTQAEARALTLVGTTDDADPALAAGGAPPAGARIGPAAAAVFGVAAATTNAPPAGAEISTQAEANGDAQAAATAPTSGLAHQTVASVTGASSGTSAAPPAGVALQTQAGATGDAQATTSVPPGGAALQTSATLIAADPAEGDVPGMNATAPAGSETPGMNASDPPQAPAQGDVPSMSGSETPEAQPAGGSGT